MREIYCNYKTSNKLNNYKLDNVELYENEKLKDWQISLNNSIKEEWNLSKEQANLEENNVSTQTMIFTFIKDYENLINYMKENKIDKIFTKLDNKLFFDTEITPEDLEDIVSQE